MGFISILLPSLMAIVSCQYSNHQVAKEWQLWKTEHKKSYESQGEELERYLVWLSNREYVMTHNENLETFRFTLTMNHFADKVREPTLFIFMPCRLKHMGILSLFHNDDTQ